MAKRIKIRVEINSTTKWATGETQQEVVFAAAKLLAEANGRCENNRVKKGGTVIQRLRSDVV